MTLPIAIRRIRNSAAGAAAIVRPSDRGRSAVVAVSARDGLLTATGTRIVCPFGARLNTRSVSAHRDAFNNLRRAANAAYGIPRRQPRRSRVAIAPDVVKRLAAQGRRVRRRVRRRRRARRSPTTRCAEAGATSPATPSEVWGADVVAKVRAPTHRGDRQAARGRRAHRLPGARDRTPTPRARWPTAGVTVVRDGGDPAHHARAVDGRAVVAGDGRGLPRRPDRGPRDGPLLPDAHDRGRHDQARVGARPGRRCRRPPGDRDRAPARRPSSPRSTSARRSRSRSTRSARSSSSSTWRPTPRAPAATPRRSTRTRSAASRSSWPRRAGRFDVVITTALIPGKPGADAADRGRRQEHEAGLRDRRPGRRGGRQLRAHPARQDDRRARRDDRRAAQPAERRCPTTRRSSTPATSCRCSS